MKILFLFVFTLSLTKLSAQDCVPFAKTEWLKASEIEVVTGDDFPENHAVIAQGTFLKSTGIISLKMLTPKLVKYIQKLAVANYCCKVFVDFENCVTDHKDDKGNSLSTTYIYCYAVRPIQQLVRTL